jgi:hypothetical protein
MNTARRKEDPVSIASFWKDMVIAGTGSAALVTSCKNRKLIPPELLTVT